MRTADAPAEAAASPHPARQRLGRRLLGGLGFTSAMCLAIGVLLATLEGGGLKVKLLYSFCIGLSCWLMIDGGRLLIGHLMAAARRRRGEPAGARGDMPGLRSLLPLVALGAVMGPTVGLLLADTLSGSRSPDLWSLQSTASRVTLTLSIGATLLAVFVGWLQERLALTRALAEAAQRAQAESQLRLLQSQLEPHMLFNTLANLRVLIGLDPPRAQAMLDRLIAFLRATLQASRATWHPLSAEFERLADYLGLMQVRMGSRLQVVLELPAALQAVAVPPLILQPLVENAIRHGLEPQVAGGRLVVRASVHGPGLRLEVEDDGVGLEAALAHSRAEGTGTGFGLEQVRSRLQTVYGPSARLRLETAPGGAGTRATLDLPLPDRGPGADAPA